MIPYGAVVPYLVNLFVYGVARGKRVDVGPGGANELFRDKVNADRIKG